MLPYLGLSTGREVPAGLRNFPHYKCIASGFEANGSIQQPEGRLDTISPIDPICKRAGTAQRRRACDKLFTPGGALPSMSLSFSLATILPPEPKDFDFS